MKTLAISHGSQVDSILRLDNGDIAISGGPNFFEVLIYRPNFKGEYVYVGSFDADG